MRFVRLAGAIAIAIAFVVTAIAPFQAGPQAAAAGVASGAQLLVDYGNGYSLMRVPRETVNTLRALPGVDPMDGRTEIDLFFSSIRFDTAVAEPALPTGLDSP